LEGCGFCHHRPYPNFKSRIPPLRNLKDRAPKHGASQIEVDLDDWPCSPVNCKYEEPKGRAPRPTIESIKRFVEMGMGVAIVSRMCVRWEVERKQLAEVRIRQLKMPRSLYLVSRAAVPASRTPR
jgi:DNA-binding transcriptional LysR family regulator